MHFISVLTLFIALLGVLTTCLPTADDINAAASHGSSGLTLEPDRGLFQILEVDAMGAQVTCETSMASPSITAIRQIQNYLINSDHDVCYQVNKECSPLVRAGDAEAGICGYKNGNLSCAQAGGGVKRIADSCAWKGRAGGKVKWTTNPGLEILVYHS